MCQEKEKEEEAPALTISEMNQYKDDRNTLEREKKD